MENFKKHALSFDAVTHKIALVKAVEKIAGGFQLILDSGEAIKGKTVIFAMGSNKRSSSSTSITRSSIRRSWCRRKRTIFEKRATFRRPCSEKLGRK